MRRIGGYVAGKDNMKKRDGGKYGTKDKAIDW